MESKKPRIRFFPEHVGSDVLWGNDTETTEAYGYPINSTKINLSATAIEKSRIVSNMFSDSLNPLYQSFPSFWRENLCVVYNAMIVELYLLICHELGDTFEILNCFEEMHQDPKLMPFTNDPIGYCLSCGISFGDKQTFLEEVKVEQARYLQYEHLVLAKRLEEAFTIYVDPTWK